MLKTRVIVSLVIVMCLAIGLPAATPPLEDTPVSQIKPLTPEQLSYDEVKFAVVQVAGSRRGIGPVAPDEGDPADKAVQYIERAANDGAVLVVFPEGFLGKIPTEHPSIAKISAAAKANSINVVVGCLEVTDIPTGEYGQNALLFNHEGELVGRYSKVHPAVGESPFFWPPRHYDVEWQAYQGEGFPVFDLNFGRVGMMICYDGYFPETYRSLALNGAEVIIWINDRTGSIEDYMVRSSVVHNYVHMLCTNWPHGKGTMIASWPNNILAMADKTEETYLCQTLNMRGLRQARIQSREYHQRRPDLYQVMTQQVPIWDMYQGMEGYKHASGHLIKLSPVINPTPPQITPSLPDGTSLQRLALHVQSDWMSGPVEIRFPETLRSSQGYHFNDHYMRDLPFDYKTPPPDWVFDEVTGVYRYVMETTNGLVFEGKAIPGLDYLELEFNVINNSDQPVEYAEANCCLSLDPCPELNADFDLSRLFMVWDGKLQPLSSTTPTPEQMNRPAWLLILRKAAAATYQGPTESPYWWLVDQQAELNLLAAVTADQKHLVGYTWSHPAATLMTNAGNPCLHTGPGPSPKVEPGERFTAYGKIYFLENDPDELVRRYHMDQGFWRWKQSQREELLGKSE